MNSNSTYIKTLVLLANIFLISYPLSAQHIHWEKSFGGTYSEYSNVIKPTSDGGYIMACASSSDDHDVSANYGGADIWLAKLDQSGNIEWEQNYGGSDHEAPNDIQQTVDGGYILAGISSSSDFDVSGNYGLDDWWIVKLDATGNIEWEQNYGGSGREYCRSIYQTKDGGYIAGGWTGSSDYDVSANYGGYDYWVVKLDTSGNIQWEKHYGGSSTEECFSMSETTDGGYVLIGFSLSVDKDISGNYGFQDYWVVKIDEHGDMQWNQHYGGSYGDWGQDIKQTTDGGFVLLGNSWSNDHDVSGNHGNGDYWVVKVDSIGTIQWERNYGGSKLDGSNAIHQTKDGGYVMVGGSQSDDFDVSANHGSNDFWIVQLDPLGYVEWKRNFGGSESDVATSVFQNGDGHLIIGGQTFSSDGDVSHNYSGGLSTSDFWIIKVGTTTGLVGEETNPVISLYPNPTEGPLSIDLGAHYSSGEALISNALGQVIQKRIFHNSRVLDLEITGASGLYFIQIHADGRQPTTLKAIKF